MFFGRSNARSLKNSMKRKYHNYAQIVQGVVQVNDPSLTQGERLFLNCLAAHAVTTHPHPGNHRLMIACGIKTRQGVNYIAQKLISKGLIEVFDHGKGGHGMAVQYRICTEDPRFPLPKPASSDLQDEPASPDLHVSNEQPASNTQRTRKYDPNNPQADGDLPASSDLQPDLDSELDSGFNTGYEPEPFCEQQLNERNTKPTIERYFDLRQKLTNGPNPEKSLERLEISYQIKFPNLWEKELKPRESIPNAQKT